MEEYQKQLGFEVLPSMSTSSTLHTMEDRNLDSPSELFNSKDLQQSTTLDNSFKETASNRTMQTFSKRELNQQRAMQALQDVLCTPWKLKLNDIEMTMTNAIKTKALLKANHTHDDHTRLKFVYKLTQSIDNSNYIDIVDIRLAEYIIGRDMIASKLPQEAAFEIVQSKQSLSSFKEYCYGCRRWSEIVDIFGIDLLFHQKVVYSFDLGCKYTWPTKGSDRKAVFDYQEKCPQRGT